MIIPGYSAERRVKRSELIRGKKKNQQKIPTTTAKPTERQQKKTNLKGNLFHKTLLPHQPYIRYL